MSHMFKPKKFRTKIFLVFVLVSILPLLIISYNSLSNVIDMRQANISEQESLAIDNASEKVKKFLDQKIEMLNLVVSATSSSLSEIDLNNLNHLIDASKIAAGDVEEISFIDKYGHEIVKRSDKGAVLADVSGEEEFQKAIAGENYFGPITYTPQGPIIRLASQIENKDKEIIGVISAVIDLNPVKNIINKIKLGNTGFVYLADREGNLIASSDSKFASPGQNLKNIKLVKDVFEGNPHFGLYKNERYKNSLGDEVIFSGRPLGKANWYAFSEWPVSDAFSVINNILKKLIIIIFFSLILVIVLSLLITRQIVKPIKILSYGAEQISRGNFNHTIHLKTKDEFEILGRRFNKMTEALKENQKLKDEFVFIAAHELRAPVTAIKGYLSMILQKLFGELPPKVEENLKIVNGSNERLVALVHDLLEVARSDAGRMGFGLSDIVIGENVKTVVNELKSLADQKGIKIKYDDSLGSNKVKAEEYKLKEIITNLINNAIKYTGSKGEINISHEIRDKYLVTHIKDNGLGIAKENLDKLFTKFFRVQSSETDRIEGTGLGLFIARMLVEKMKGQIWVESELGKGSTFSFSLLLV